MRFSAFFQQCFHRIKRTLSRENFNHQIRVAWAENSNEPLTFQTLLNGFTTSTDPIMNFITKGEVAASKNSIIWFIFLHVNLFMGIGLQILEMWIKRDNLELVDIVNRGDHLTTLTSRLLRTVGNFQIFHFSTFYHGGLLYCLIFSLNRHKS